MRRNCIALIALALIGLFILKPAIDNQDKKEEQVAIKEETIQVTRKSSEISIAEFKDILSEVSITTENEEKLSNEQIGRIIKSLGLVNELDENYGITRYQMADILYSIMLEYNKLPELLGYQLTYKDANKMPKKYIQPICYTSYLNFYDFGSTFSGYTFVTTQEVNNAIAKCKKYITEVEQQSETDKVNSTKENTDTSQIDILDRTLNSNIKSSAIIQNPSKLSELKTNVSNIREIDLSNIDTKYIGETAETAIQDRIYVDYIMIEQGLYGDISKVRGKIQGITKAKSIKFKDIGPYGEGEAFTCNELVMGYEGFMFGIEQVLGIKNNEIIDVGYIVRDIGFKESTFFVTDKSIDTVGFIVPRSSLEGTLYTEESQSNLKDLVVILVQLE